MIKLTNFGLLRSVTTQEITRYVDQDESVEGDKVDDDVGDGDDEGGDDGDDDDRERIERGIDQFATSC